MLNALTQVFYTISTALLVPTELALLVALALACRLTGSVAREALVRRRQSNARRQLEQRLEQDASFDVNAYLSTSRGETTSSANDATSSFLKRWRRRQTTRSLTRSSANMKQLRKNDAKALKDSQKLALRSDLWER